MTAPEQAARLLRQQVVQRLRLAESLVIEVPKGECDFDVGSLLYDAAELCEALATLLETGEMPKWKPGLEQEAGLRLIGRIAADNGADIGANQIHFLAKELLGQEPPAPAAAEQDEA